MHALLVVRHTPSCHLVCIYVCVCVADGQTLFSASCQQAKQKAPWLACDDSEQYAPTQCRSNSECFCVDPQTGVPLDGSKFSRMEADSVMCEGICQWLSCMGRQLC